MRSLPRARSARVKCRKCVRRVRLVAAASAIGAVRALLASDVARFSVRFARIGAVLMYRAYVRAYDGTSDPVGSRA